MLSGCSLVLSDAPWCSLGAFSVVSGSSLGALWFLPGRGPGVVPELASEASFVCFVVILGHARASSQQVGSESHVNMEFSQQAG